MNPLPKIGATVPWDMKNELKLNVTAKEWNKMSPASKKALYRVAIPAFKAKRKAMRQKCVGVVCKRRIKLLEHQQLQFENLRLQEFWAQRDQQPMMNDESELCLEIHDSKILSASLSRENVHLAKYNHHLNKRNISRMRLIRAKQSEIEQLCRRTSQTKWQRRQVQKRIKYVNQELHFCRKKFGQIRKGNGILLHRLALLKNAERKRQKIKRQWTKKFVKQTCKNEE